MTTPLQEALRLPLAADLSGFLMILQHQGVPCRVCEESDEQVLWVPSTLVTLVRELYARYQQGGIAPIRSVVEKPSRVVPSLRAVPATVAVLLVTLLCAVVTALGDNLAAVQWLTFVDFKVQGEYMLFASLSYTLSSYEWWRLLTPIFVHFGILHLAMNGLWYWELGRRIEICQGHWALLGLTVIFGLVANFAQYLYGGVGIFGGLSGVLYGLLGHCWIFQKLAPNNAYRLPPGVIGMMLIWLLICLSGLINIASLGTVAIANAAHVSGLLVGCLSGALGGMWARRARAAR